MAKSMKLREDKTKKTGEYKSWLVECQGQCEYKSIMKLIEELKKNPYYAAIEKLVLKVDSKNRNSMTFQLVVSTYAK